MPGIFISYRRADSNTVTGRIYDRLVTAFGADSVFKDVDDIPMGADFRSVLEQEVAASNVLLLIIGEHWLNIRDIQGNRRLDDPNDFVRIEAEASLSRPDNVVIPVLVNGARMPREDELPLKLQPLVYRNAAVVRDDPDFNRDTIRLIEQIKRYFPLPQAASAVPVPPPPAAKPNWPLRGVSTVIVVAVLVAAFFVARGLSNNASGDTLLTPESTNSVSSLPTDLPAPTSTPQPSATVTPTPTPRPSNTPTPTPTSTPVPSNTPTLTSTPTSSDTPTPTPTSTPVPSDTPTPTSTPTSSDTPTPTPTSTPVLPQILRLGERTELEFAQRYLPGYIPGSVRLEPVPIEGLVEPTYEGSNPLYGAFTLGDYQEFVVVFDETSAEDGRLYIDLNSNRDLTDESPFYIRDHQTDFQPVEFMIDYGDKELPYWVRFEYFNDFNAEIGFFQLQFVIESYWQGTVYLGGIPYLIAVDDFNANGIFNESDTMWGADQYWIDLNGDGYFTFEDDFGSSLANSVEIDGVCYGVVELSRSGDTLQLGELAKGTIEGTVYDNDTGQTIGGAQFSIGGKTSVSSANGHFSLSLCPGYYDTLFVKRSGYVPDEMTDEQTGYYLVKANEVVIDDAYLTAAPDAPSGEVTLSDGESYHFLTGERGYYSGGEFYVVREDGQMMFFGNNDQRGITLLGDLGDIDLYTVSFCHLTDADYTRYGVEAIPGNVYVALARAGEEGNFVVFRVKEVLSNAVVLDYVYRDYC
jgi:hypothetical protein